ncbi:uncharacterized protein [Henckelia pumila]|uniref:uncharacterized protein n=1 Tax=Henckelia pumila TaxID=405737 RepID=UPI003C6E02AE
MAPGGIGRKGKEVVEESAAENVRNLDDIVRRRRGRPAVQPPKDLELEVEQQPRVNPDKGKAVQAEADPVAQLTEKMGGIRLIISQFQELRPQKFFGNERSEKAASWLKSLNNKFNGLEYPDEIRLNEKITWEVFRIQFAQEYAPPSYYSAKEDEFNLLVQGNKSVAEYASQFLALLPYVPHVVKNDRSKLSHFLKGLTRTIHTLVTTETPSTYMKAVEKAKKIEASLLRGEPQSIPASVPQGAGSSSQTPMGLLPYQPTQSSQQAKKPWLYIWPERVQMREDNSLNHNSLPYVPVQPPQQPRYSSPQSQQRFPGPQQAQVHAMTQDQAQDAPGGVIAGFMIYALDVTKEEKLKVSDIPVVKDFPDVFPDEIPGFPPQREIDLSIELMPGTSPIFRAPYRLAPAELKELKAQLQDLLEKGYYEE